MVTYTTAALVKAEIQNYDTSISDDTINVFIENAEGLIDCVMGESFKSIYDSTKFAHRLIRLATTKLALIDLIKWDIVNQFGTSTAGMQLDVARGQSDRALALLSDPKVVKFIKGETH